MAYGSLLEYLSFHILSVLESHAFPIVPLLESQFYPFVDHSVCIRAPGVLIDLLLLLKPFFEKFIIAKVLFNFTEVFRAK